VAAVRVVSIDSAVAVVVDTVIALGAAKACLWSTEATVGIFEVDPTVPVVVAAVYAVQRGNVALFGIVFRIVPRSVTGPIVPVDVSVSVVVDSIVALGVTKAPLDLAVEAVGITSVDPSVSVVVETVPAGRYLTTARASATLRFITTPADIGNAPGANALKFAPASTVTETLGKLCTAGGPDDLRAAAFERFRAEPDLAPSFAIVLGQAHRADPTLIVNGPNAPSDESSGNKSEAENPLHDR